MNTKKNWKTNASSKESTNNKANTGIWGKFLNSLKGI